jgi:hypothetical protein
MNNNANSITVSGDDLKKLRKLSGFVDSMANHYNVEDSLTFKREYLPSFSDSDWSLLRDLAEGRTIGLTDKNGVLQSLNASKGYTPEQVSRILDFLIVGQPGKELNAIGNYYEPYNQGTVSRGVGIHKPAAAPKASYSNNNAYYYSNANNYNKYNYRNNNNAYENWRVQQEENREHMLPRGSTAKTKRNYRKSRKNRKSWCRKASRRNGKK